MRDLYQNDVQIVSDGTADGTYVLMDKRPLTGVSSVKWSFDTDSKKATVTMELDNPHHNGHPPLTTEGNQALELLLKELFN